MGGVHSTSKVAAERSKEQVIRALRGLKEGVFSSGTKKNRIVLAATKEIPALDGLNVRPGERT